MNLTPRPSIVVKSTQWEIEGQVAQDAMEKLVVVLVLANPLCGRGYIAHWSKLGREGSRDGAEDYVQTKYLRLDIGQAAL